MASLILCEKCGKSDTKLSEFMHVRGHKLTSATEFKTFPEEYMDVCMKCYKKIFNKEEEN